jgi:hypothetical protein
MFPATGQPVEATTAFLVVMAVISLTRPYFTFDPVTRTIVARVGAGPMSRRYGGYDGSTLYFTGDRIVCTHLGGRVERVPVSRKVANAAGWEAVTARLR